MIAEDIDLAAGDFESASWRRKMGPQQQYDSTLEEASKNARLPLPLGLPPLLGLGGIPREWSDEGGFLSTHPKLIFNIIDS